MSGWQTRAACKDADPNTFFPSGDSYPEWIVDEANKWCNGCPVADQCLEANLDEPHGIYAATTPHDRKQMKKRRARQVAGIIGDKRAINPPKFAKSPRCPEPGRYRSVVRHLSIGERLCLECAVFDAGQARTSALDQRVLSLTADGHSPAAIARQLGMGRNTVAGIIRKYRKRDMQRAVAA